MEELKLNAMLQAQGSAERELRSEPDVIRHFLVPSGMIARDGRKEGTNATCTAFCLYYFSAADLFPRATSRHKFAALTREEAVTTVRSLGSEIVRQHSAGRKQEITATSGLPNQYNSSIQLAGYLSTVRHLGLEIPDSTKAKCDDILVRLVSRFFRKAHGGWVARIESPDAPSAYLTFWTAAAVQEWLLSGFCDPNKMAKFEDCLSAVAGWSEQELTNSIAYHYTGFRSRVDVVEMIYSILCSAKFGRASTITTLARRGLDILFSAYFDHGCFAPSAPVLADKHNYSLQCPTAEVLALLTALQANLLSEHWEALCTTAEWLSQYRIAGKGWIPESSGRSDRPTAFMTASAITFLACFSRLLDESMHEGACAILSVPRTPPSAPRGFKYPEKLGKILRSHMIQPLTGKPRREDLASYSMILYGPPGTAKTTIARKLASDLGWPLHLINQNAFLQKGVANIDAEAERVFRLVGYLKDIVVLFDEVEELVEERTKTDKISRMLTTAMLPRLHDLRDLQKVVFIFATNRLDSIDNAAARLGRFDIVHGISPPSPDEREEMIVEILRDLAVDEEIVEAFKAADVAQTAENFCYIDLYALARHAKVSKVIDGESITAVFVMGIQRIYERRVKHESFKKSLTEVKDNSKDVDRP